MLGSAGSDDFVGTPESSALFGTGYYNRAKYFDEVFSDLSQGGDDRVSLEDTDEDDTLLLDGSTAQLAAVARVLYRVEGLGSGDLVRPVNTHQGDNDAFSAIAQLYLVDWSQW
jgi:hypothetical protein